MTASPSEPGSFWQDVTAHGATGLGTGNDGPAIQDAVNALPGQGGVVYFPAGVYRVASSIVLPDGIAGTHGKNVLFKGDGIPYLGKTGTGAFNPATGPSVLYWGSELGTAPILNLVTTGGATGAVTPRTFGGIEGLSFVKGEAGTAGHAIEVNALIGGSWTDVSIQGFGDKGLLVNGEQFYMTYYRLNMANSQYRARSIINHASFFNCNFAEMSSTSPAFYHIMDLNVGGTGPVFYGCFFERSNGPAIQLEGNHQGAEFHGCYWEINNKFNTAAGAADILVNSIGAESAGHVTVSFFGGVARLGRESGSAGAGSSFIRMNGTGMHLNCYGFRLNPEDTSMAFSRWNSTQTYLLCQPLTRGLNNSNSIPLVSSSGSTPANIVNTHGTFPAT